LTRKEKTYFSTFYENNNTLYFSGYSAAYGQDVMANKWDRYRHCLVADMNAGGDAKPGNWLSHRFTLYFAADDGTHGRELWKLEKSGPTLVADINPGNGSSDPSKLMGWGYNLVVSAADSAGQEPWSIEPISGIASRLGNMQPYRIKQPKSICLIRKSTIFYGR
jgi:ELWxxDGT repeat protein